MTALLEYFLIANDEIPLHAGDLTEPGGDAKQLIKFTSCHSGIWGHSYTRGYTPRYFMDFIFIISLEAMFLEFEPVISSLMDSREMKPVSSLCGTSAVVRGLLEEFSRLVST